MKQRSCQTHTRNQFGLYNRLIFIIIYPKVKSDAGTLFLKYHIFQNPDRLQLRKSTTKERMEKCLFSSNPIFRIEDE